MERDVQNITQSLLGAAKAKGLDTAQIGNIMSSPEGRALMAQLNAPGGEKMKDAAARAAEGDTSALSSLLSSLMSTKEGKSVAQQVKNIQKNG